MKKRLKILGRVSGSLVIGFLFLVPCAFAQDLHFSQFMNSPLLTNPANTGFIPAADYRLGMNYRNQWSAIMTVPYKTMSAFGDVQVFRNRIETGWMGLGGVILHDVAGSGNLTSTRVYGSVAYHQMINAGSLLSAGFNIGWANKQINVTNLKFPDQYDGKFFDNHLPTGVALSENNINYLDLQAGLGRAEVGDRLGVVHAVAAVAGEQRERHVGGARIAGRAGELEVGVAAAGAVAGLAGQARPRRLAAQQHRRAERRSPDLHVMERRHVSGRLQALARLAREQRRGRDESEKQTAAPHENESSTQDPARCRWKVLIRMVLRS